MTKSTTWTCRHCGHVTTLITGGGWTSLPNGWCSRSKDGKHAYGEPVVR